MVRFWVHCWLLWAAVINNSTAEDAWYPYDSNVWSSSLSKSHFLCSTGKMQSPVDLPVCEEADIRDAIAINWGTHEIELSNNHHTVEAKIKGIGKSTMTVNSKSYTLRQCHWHWGSEHTVGGVQKVLAGHCVHTLDAAQGQNTRYGVLGVLYDIGSTADPFLDLLKNHLPSTGRRLANEPIISQFKGPVNFDLIHSKISRTKYWTYSGSFTTPPCTEAVDWYPLMESATITTSQLEAFKNAIGWEKAGGNYRPPQPLHERDVQGCKTSKWYPYNSAAWASMKADSGLCRNGKQQSPVDLPKCHKISKRPPINVAWGTRSNVKLVNNGHSVKIDVATSSSTIGPPTMKMDGKVYTLKQCHWHSGSEHTVSGQQLPLVVHCVHQNDADLGKYGVLGIFYTLGISQNEFLAAFEDRLPEHDRHGSNDVESDFTGPIDFNLLHQGTDKNKYWTYEGSLTTPPCSEVVDWYILMDYLTLEQVQLTKMETAMGWAPYGGNYRPPQELNGRKIAGCDAAMYPYDKDYWASQNSICASGRKQSPIDLPDCIASEPDLATIELKWKTGDVDLKNTGKALKADLRSTVDSKMVVDGTEYTLDQCHWHWGSEHTVGGTQRDMVVHCVHSRDLNPTDGKKWYGVLGVFYELGAADAFIESIKSEIASITADPNAQPSINSDLTSIVKGLALGKYWQYEGSFTTPPCTEVVDWYILQESQQFSQAQYESLKNVIGWSGQNGNFRPPQPLHSRIVRGCNAQSPVAMPTCPFFSLTEGLTIEWSVMDTRITSENGILKFAVASGDKMIFSGTTYTLKYCELRPGSEHLLPEHGVEMSLQCYHKKDGTNRMGAVSVQYKVGLFLDGFFEQIDSELPTPTVPVVTRLDWAKAVTNLDLERFLKYDGSRTSTPYDEVVDWFVMMDTQTVSQSQLDKVKAAIGSSLQSRPFQPLHSRTVQGCGQVKLPKCSQPDVRQALDVKWGDDVSVEVGRERGGSLIKASVSTNKAKTKFGSVVYTLEYCQIRQGSVFEIEDVNVVLSLECAHTRDDNGDMGWVVVFYEVSADPADSSDPFLREIELHLPAGSSPWGFKSIDLDLESKLADYNFEQYWTYSDPTSSPKMSHWYLMMKPRKIPQSQLDRFKTATEKEPTMQTIKIKSTSVQGCSLDVAAARDNFSIFATLRYMMAMVFAYNYRCAL